MITLVFTVFGMIGGFCAAYILGREYLRDKVEELERAAKSEINNWANEKRIETLNELTTQRAEESKLFEKFKSGIEAFLDAPTEIKSVVIDRARDTIERSRPYIVTTAYDKATGQAVHKRKYIDNDVYGFVEEVARRIDEEIDTRENQRQVKGQ